MKLPPVSFQLERADQADVQALIAALDAYQLQLYPAPALCPRPVDALLQAHVRLAVVRDAHRRALACGAVWLHESHAELDRLMVLPDWRGGGLGAALVEVLQAEALKAGRDCLRLEMGVRQTAAQRLYERQGFRRCTPFDAGRGGVFRVYMEKRLCH
ncbi:GNAT family N-acetyltransferase [Roseateles koreensis]|uniref:GNAT family N-acetyltransferase n=1 Tax=Roseateles koreensis TaxID=2987526 RepID=A0ABT5KSM0_9BURK|nr:GNAT family N-acetyltransferase [Roseateles koreensis]MDC8784866.1 GNAT family N-acetyltransferase [Roseateles koreensis]